MGLTVGDRKKFTEKVQTKVSGKEETDANSKATNNCSILLVVDKGDGKKGVACFKRDNKQSGLVYCGIDL